MDLEMSPEENKMHGTNGQTSFDRRTQNGDDSIGNTLFMCQGQSVTLDSVFETSQESSDTDNESNCVNSSQSLVDEVISVNDAAHNIVIQEVNIINDSLIEISSTPNSSVNFQSPTIPAEQGSTGYEVIYECVPSEVANAPLVVDPGVIPTENVESQIGGFQSSLQTQSSESELVNGIEKKITAESEMYSISGVACCVDNICTDVCSTANDIDTGVNSLPKSDTNDGADSEHIDAAATLCCLATDGNNSLHPVNKSEESPRDENNIKLDYPSQFTSTDVSNLIAEAPPENCPPLDEYDSDSTIPISPGKLVLEIKQPVASENAKSSNSSYLKSKCFSPLPSTSSDYVTFDLNDLRFSEAESIIKCTETAENTKCDSPFIVVDGDTASSETFEGAKDEVVQIANYETDSLDILICENEPVTVDLDLYKPKVIDPNEVIDLLGDDSDCEIVDTVKATPVQNLNSPIDLSSSYEINFVNDTFSEAVTSSINAISAAESPIDLDNLPTSTVMDSANLLLSCDSTLNSYLESLLSPIVTNIHTQLKVDCEFPTRRSKRGVSKRESAISKRRRINAVVDLSETSVSTMPTVSRVSAPTQMGHMMMGQSASVSYPIYQPLGVNSTIPPPQLPAPSYIMKNPYTSEPVQETPPKSCLGECPVCYETLSISATASTFCGHVFCLDCIKKVMKTSKKCPKCRKALTGRGFHQLFL